MNNKPKTLEELLSEFDQRCKESPSKRGFWLAIIAYEFIMMAYEAGKEQAKIEEQKGDAV